MWHRSAEKRLLGLAEKFPAVVVVGSRQVGKTTLAQRVFPAAEYQDLESPLIREKFSDDPGYALGRLGSMSILDEAQAVPEVFAALRGAIDDRRGDQRCHFCILGSAQPALIRGVSESLAGRVGILELDPLTPSETGEAVERHWVEGGFPEALRVGFRDWWEPYIAAVLQRDLAAYGYRPDAFLLRRLLAMLAAQQGGLLNLSSLGNALGVSYHTVKHGIDLLEGVFLVRRLPPYFCNVGKRLVKSPKVYVRDPGLLHHLLNISALAELDVHPIRGASWEGFVIEDLIRRERLTSPHSQFFFWRTAAGGEADLVIDRGSERIVVEVKANSGTSRGDAKRLERVLDDVGAVRGFVVGSGAASGQLTPRVQNLSLDLEPAWLP